MAWAHAHPEFRPWIPDSLRDEVDGYTLQSSSSYVVVEEILLGEVRTVVSAWPVLDRDGQLQFGNPENAEEYIDTVADVERLLSEPRVMRVGALQGRPVAVGDVLAVLGPLGGGPRPGGGGGPGGDEPDGDGGGGRLTAALQEVSWARIYDITPDARRAATATYASATAGALSADDARRFFDDGEDETKGDGGPPVTPEPGGGPPLGEGDEKPREAESLVDVVSRPQVPLEEAAPQSAPATADA
jgi:hypothetical protein